jgi:hypothetical protein
MATVEKELAEFTSYARRQLDAGRSDLSIDELFDQWRIENPSDDQFAENVAAVQASIQDFKRGDRGTIAAEHSAQLRREFGLGNK